MYVNIKKYKKTLTNKYVYKYRPARTDVPSMYAEDDTLEDEFTRQPTRCSRASTIRSTRYVSEGFVQYSQPSLNGT